jgi:hypothetical protein
MAVLYDGFMPEPNTAPYPGTNDLGNWRYTASYPSGTGSWTGRMDHNWSPSNTTHFSITEFGSNNSATAPIPMLAASHSFVTSYTLALNHNWVVNPTTVLTIRLAGVHTRTFSGSTTPVDDSSWNLPAPLIDLLGGTNNDRTPEYGGINTLGSAQVSDVRETSYQGSLSLQKMIGRNTIKSGFEIRKYFTNIESGGYNSIWTAQANTAMSQPTWGSTGDEEAGYLIGSVNYGAGYQYAGPACLRPYYGAYLQDDIKVTKKLSVNVGMRWDFEEGMTERYNREEFLDRNYVWNVNPDPTWSWAQVQAAVNMPNLPMPQWLLGGPKTGRLALTGTPEYPFRSFENEEPFHFGPRLGLAYQLTPKTVIRASYDIIWMTKTGDEYLDYAFLNNGYGDSAIMPYWSTGSVLNSFANPFPAGSSYYLPRTTDETRIALTQEHRFHSMTPWFSPGHEHTMSLSLQRQLGSGKNTWLAQIAFNGEAGRGLPMHISRATNELPNAGILLANLGNNLLKPVPNPFASWMNLANGGNNANINLGLLYDLNPLSHGSIPDDDPFGVSNYSSGYVQIEHRFAHGFGFMANYTLAKMLDDCESVDGLGEDAQAAYPRVEQAALPLGKDAYGIGTSDFRHKLVFNYSFELPFGTGKKYLTSPSTLGSKVLDKIVGGWVAAGVTTYHTGTQALIWGYNADWYNAGQSTTAVSERPCYVVDKNNKLIQPYKTNVSGHRALIGSPNHEAWANKAAFRLINFYPNYAEVGTTPIGFSNWTFPGFSQWDFSLMKNFYLGKETRYFQVRMEASNLFNHMNCAYPDMTITDGTFGTISGYYGSPRLLMVAAKLYF